jgi:hypothetical protein
MSSSTLRAVGSDKAWWKACLLVKWILEGPYDEGAAYVGAASWTILLPICENSHFELVAINVPVRGASERSTLVYTSIPDYHKRTINPDALLEELADCLCDVVSAMPKLNARNTLEWLKNQKSVGPTKEAAAKVNVGQLISLQNSFNEQHSVNGCGLYVVAFACQCARLGPDMFKEADEQEKNPKAATHYFGKEDENCVQPEACIGQQYSMLISAVEPLLASQKSNKDLLAPVKAELFLFFNRIPDSE